MFLLYFYGSFGTWVHKYHVRTLSRLERSMIRLTALPNLRGLLILCLLLPVIAGAQDPTLLVVRQEGGDGAFQTIEDALKEIPKDLVGH